MEEKEKVIDLWCLAKLLYAYKLLVIGLALLGVAIGFGYKYMTFTPLYQTDIQVVLPLYCDSNSNSNNPTVATAVILASSQEKIMGKTTNDFVVTSHRAETAANRADTNIICITIQGPEPQCVKKFADTYEQNLITYLNSFVNDKTLYDMQKANLQSARPLSREELLKRCSLNNVKIVKHASKPTKLPAGYATPMALGAFFGLFIVTAYVAIKHFEEIVKEESYQA